MYKGICEKILIYIFISVFFAPYFTKALAFNRTLAPGSRGADVFALQQTLKGLGYFTYPKITGYYGQVTLLAVQGFQRALRRRLVCSPKPVPISLIEPSYFQPFEGGYGDGTVAFYDGADYRDAARGGGPLGAGANYRADLQAPEHIGARLLPLAA